MASAEASSSSGHSHVSAARVRPTRPGAPRPQKPGPLPKFASPLTPAERAIGKVSRVPVTPTPTNVGGRDDGSLPQSLTIIGTTESIKDRLRKDQSRKRPESPDPLLTGPPETADVPDSPKEPKPAKTPKGPKTPKTPKTPKSPKPSRPPKTPRSPKDPKTPKAPKKPRKPRKSSPKPQRKGKSSYKLPSISGSSSVSDRTWADRQKRLRRLRKEKERARKGKGKETRKDRFSERRREEVLARAGADNTLVESLPVQLEEIPGFDNNGLHEIISVLDHHDRIQLALMMPELYLNDERVNMIANDPRFLFHIQGADIPHEQAPRGVLLHVYRGIIQNIRALGSRVFKQALRRSLPIVIDALALERGMDQATADLIRYLVELSEPLSAHLIHAIGQQTYVGGLVVLAAALEKVGFYTSIEKTDDGHDVLVPLAPPAHDPDRIMQSEAGEDLLLQLVEYTQYSRQWFLQLFYISQDSAFRNIQGRLLYRSLVEDEYDAVQWLLNNNCNRSMQAVYWAIIQDNRPLIRALLEEAGHGVPKRRFIYHPPADNVYPSPPFGFDPPFPGKSPDPHTSEYIMDRRVALGSVDAWADRGLPYIVAAMKVGDQSLAQWLEDYLHDKPDDARRQVPRWTHTLYPTPRKDL
ncbi:hypothetical protein F5B19DRAFT_451211 [Rostrohypoxylon terebratum]|nr:hypothetical protein F5B19DRAFT_451211 [Rostrohypoxylon terebratum]